MADERVAPSPRTGSEPMRFTRWEFVRGAIAAWVWFLLLHQLFLLIPLVGYGLWGLFATVPWSIGAAIVGAPAALALGWTMRRQPNVLLHVLAFTAFGLMVGAVTTALARWLPAWGVPGEGFGDLFLPTVLVALSAGPAVALGWWFTARRALAEDHSQTLDVPDPSSDEAYEDSL